MGVFPTVLVATSGANADWPESVVSSRGHRLAGDTTEADVIVLDATDGSSSAPASAVLARVREGSGLVVLVDRSTGSDEQGGQPLDEALAAALAEAGITLDSRPADPGAIRVTEEIAAATDLDLLARVDPERLHIAGTMTVRSPAAPLLRPTAGRVAVTGLGSDVSTRSDLPAEPSAVSAVGRLGAGRVVVLGVRPEPAADELLFNAIYFAAGHLSQGRSEQRSSTATDRAWQRLKSAVTELQQIQASDGSIPEPADHPTAQQLMTTVIDAITDLSPRFPHDADYLAALAKDLIRWQDAGFAVPDFLDSLVAFHPEQSRRDGREHLVLFPMYTQNGSPDRHLEAVLVQVIWPAFVAELEAGEYSNKLFVPIRFLDFTAGYDTNSAVLFPETVAMREVPKFTWGAIFADREAARFRTVVTAAAQTTKLALPPDAARLLDDQQLAEETFVMWDLIHDRTHMHGDLPFDPFMIKQRMPYFLYSLEELRCDLTAFRESVALESKGVSHARLVQYAVIFDRIFRFAITGTRVRNYDGLGGQLLFAWLHQHRVLHWTDNRLAIDWDRVTGVVLELGEQIEALYWRSIDRPKVNHWLAAYQLVAGTLEPHPASVWARGPEALPLSGPPKGLTDAVLPDEFPLSMFYEALSRKLSPVVASTAGITG